MTKRDQLILEQIQDCRRAYQAKAGSELATERDRFMVEQLDKYFEACGDRAAASSARCFCTRSWSKLVRMLRGCFRSAIGELHVRQSV